MPKQEAQPVRIVAAPGELNEGLFGGVFLFVLEILPVLQARKLRPAWAIASCLYGEDPDFLVIPGVIDPAHPPPTGRCRDILLRDLRRRPCALGSDWSKLHTLWTDYFKIPAAVETTVDELGDLSGTLGVHYRGNDKKTCKWDSNPVEYDEFVLIVLDFLRADPTIDRVFVATDEFSFVDYLRQRIGRPLVNLGEARFHKALEGTTGRSAEATRALTDCVALARCGAVLTTSSALSAFAKVLNPDLDIRRCAASKLFADVPYFPIAYIPPYRSSDPAVAAVLARTMSGDWTTVRAGRRFKPVFAWRRRPRRLVARVGRRFVRAARDLALRLPPHARPWGADPLVLARRWLARGWGRVASAL